VERVDEIIQASKKLFKDLLEEARRENKLADKGVAE
jgi:hypothetical protein